MCKVRVMLSLAYGCGLRAGEVVRLRVGDIDSGQQIIQGRFGPVSHKGRITVDAHHTAADHDDLIWAYDGEVFGEAMFASIRWP